MASKTENYEGGCTCRQVRYRLTSKPMFVHCCHCRWCQRETGTAFALNAMIEADRVETLAGDVEVVDTPSNSGRGQRISRCPRCRIAVWSNYSGAGDAVRAAGELHGGGVGEEFALAADGGLDELREENANPSDEIQNRASPEEQCHNRAAVFVVAGSAPGRRGRNAHEDSAEDGEKEDSIQ